MPTEINTPYWVYVNSSAKGNFIREAQALAYAKQKITNKNEVVVIQIGAFNREKRLHVWVNGVQTVKNGKNTGK
jgi:hypothetical protein